MSLSWRRTFPDTTHDFALERERAGGEPEILGRILRHSRSTVADAQHGWTWSLTCHYRPVFPPRPRTATSGFEETKEAAVEGLMKAWRREEAWRAEIRTRPDFGTLSPSLRQYVTHGQPTPAWKRIERSKERTARPESPV